MSAAGEMNVAGLIAEGAPQTQSPVPVGIKDDGGVARAITGSSGGDVNIQGRVASGNPTPGNPVPIGGLAATNSQAIGANVAKQLFVTTQGQRATYSTAVNAHAPAATPTDWFTIQGSATTIIRITSLKVALRATAGTQYRVSALKYSVYLTGGTGAATTIVPHDRLNSAATVVVKTWAGGLPTPGTPVGKITDDSLPVSVLGTPIFNNEPGMYDFGVSNEQPIVLRGTDDYLALNSAGVALPGGLVADVYVRWTESAD